MAKQTTTQKFLRDHPYCCFCGGNTLATTRDHVPSRQLFTLKLRPKGLEVPACDYCNGITGQDEQIAAMLSRLFPDPETQEEKDEMKEIFEAVSINNPDVLREMEPSFVQKKRMRKSGLPGHALNVRGPLVNRAVHQFGRKLTMAAHYDITGNIIPRGAGVAVRWFTNYQAMTEGLPPELGEHFGPPRTLKQGKWGVDDQFFIQWIIADTGAAGGYFAAFRKSFAILGAVDSDRAFLETFGNGVVFDVFEPPEYSAQTSSDV